MNYYKLLEISPAASFEVIKIAYNIACEKYQDDDEKITVLRAAYVTLTNKTTREKYDKILPCIEQNQEERSMEKLKQELYERKYSDTQDTQRICTNYYELLDVSPTASAELITTAYRIAREKCFYDEEKMQLLLIAYETLTDDTVREEYDMIHANTDVTMAYAAVPKKQGVQAVTVKTQETAKSREEQENIRNKEFRKRYIEQERRMNQEIYYARKQIDDNRANRMAEGLREFREKEQEKERNMKQLKLTEEEHLTVLKRREEQAKRWKEEGLCEYCGGKLSLFGRKCKSCKK